MSNYDEALRLIALLNDDERAQLHEDLTERIQRNSKPKHSVLEFRGAGRHNHIPMDAQEFVNQERDSWNDR